MTITQSVIQPLPGDNVHWLCIKCGRRFSAPLPQKFFGFDRFIFFDKKPKCPQCGSYLVMQDPCIVY